MADIKNETVNPNGEAANENATNPDQNANEKKPGKIGSFFEKHGKKIKTGAMVVGAVCAGVVADRLGLKLGGKKKDDDRPAATEADV